MKIEIGNYTIESDSISGYNLNVNKTRKTGKNIGSVYQENLGWNMSLEKAANKIIEHALSEINLTFDSTAFIKVFREETDKLIRSIKEVEKTS